jgi:hypothetical protein
VGIKWKKRFTKSICVLSVDVSGGYQNSISSAYAEGYFALRKNTGELYGMTYLKGTDYNEI